MTGSTPHLSGRPLPRRSVVQGGAALGVTSLALPSAAFAASPLDAVYTSVVEGGRVYGWGPYYSSPGSLGSGVSNDVRTPRLLTGGSAAFEAAEIVKVFPADYVGLALDASGTVYSWGEGSYGTLGSGSTVDRTGPQAITAWTSDGSTSISAPRIVDLATSARAIAAVASDGHIYAWGTQSGSEVGLPSDNTVYSTPRRVTDTLGLTDTVGTADRIVQVAGGFSLAVWLDAEGVVRTSGWEFRTDPPRLGQGDQADTFISTTANVITGDLAGTAGTAARVVQVDAGQNFGFALGRDGAIYGWGLNNVGQLGFGDTTNRFVPTQLPRSGDDGSSSALPALADTDKRITQISVGASHCLALGLDGSVYAWGSARYGKLGNGISTSTTYAWPIDITGNGALPAAGGAGRIIQVVAGLDSSYALGADGSVYSWGEGAEYQRGDNDSTESQPDPVLISSLGAFADLKPSDGTAYSRVVYLSTHPSGEADVVYALDNSSLL